MLWKYLKAESIGDKPAYTDTSSHRFWQRFSSPLIVKLAESTKLRRSSYDDQKQIQKQLVVVKAVPEAVVQEAVFNKCKTAGDFPYTIWLKGA